MSCHLGNVDVKKKVLFLRLWWKRRVNPPVSVPLGARDIIWFLMPSFDSLIKVSQQSQTEFSSGQQQMKLGPRTKVQQPGTSDQSAHKKTAFIEFFWDSFWIINIFLLLDSFSNSDMRGRDLSEILLICQSWCPPGFFQGRDSRRPRTAPSQQQEITTTEGS